MSLFKKLFRRFKRATGLSRRGGKNKSGIVPPPGPAAAVQQEEANLKVEIDEIVEPEATEPESVDLGRYERLGDQHQNSRAAVKFLPKQFRSKLGQLPEDLGNRILTVTKAVEAGAAVLQKPQTPPPAEPVKTLTVDIPYVPVTLAVLVVIGIYIFLRQKK